MIGFYRKSPANLKPSFGLFLPFLLFVMAIYLPFCLIWFAFHFFSVKFSLVAVAVAFFLCWAPFHSQRLMAVYGKSSRPTSELFRNIYTVLTYVSGVLYFMSTCINPLLYSIMSHKFRNAFKVIKLKCQLYLFIISTKSVFSLSDCINFGQNNVRCFHRKVFGFSSFF